MDTWRRAALRDRTYLRFVIGERRTVQAFLEAKPLSRGGLEVELRDSSPTTDPRTGQPLLVPPVVILWIVPDRRMERAVEPVAVRVRTVVAISRFPPDPRLVSMLEADCLAAGLAVERMPEAGLWRLFAHPPRPRLAH